MKIYFGFTVAGERSGLEAARRIVHLLEKLGHEVLTRHLVEDDAWEADRRISPRDVYQRDMAWLQAVRYFYRGSVRVFLRIGIRGRLRSRLYPKESDPLVPARSRRETVAADQRKFARELHSHALHKRTGGRRVHTRHPDERGIADRAAR